MMKSFFQQRRQEGWRSLKLLLIGTVVISLTAILFEKLFLSMGLKTPFEVFSLTSNSYTYGFIWQFLTFPLLLPAYQGLSLGFLLSLGFHCYLLWMVGSSICSTKGEKKFISLYVFSTLFAALSLIGMHIWMHFPLAYCGGKTLTYTLLLAWAALNPESRLMLFFIAPIKASTLILVGLGFNLFLDISSLAFHEVAAYLASSLYTYFHIVLGWKLKGPFHALHNFEEKLKKTFSFSNWKKPSSLGSSKIYDFKTGKTITNDKAFFHAAMAKISLKGKKSLTWKERFRLYRVARKLDNSNSN